MCLATNEAGGPRRCSGDARNAHHRTRTTLNTLETANGQLNTAPDAHDHRILTQYHQLHQLPAHDRDAALHRLTADELDALAAAANRQITPAVDAALNGSPVFLSRGARPWARG